MAEDAIVKVLAVVTSDGTIRDAGAFDQGVVRLTCCALVSPGSRATEASLVTRKAFAYSTVGVEPVARAEGSGLTAPIRQQEYALVRETLRALEFSDTGANLAEREALTALLVEGAPEVSREAIEHAGRNTIIRRQTESWHACQASTPLVVDTGCAVP